MHRGSARLSFVTNLLEFGYDICTGRSRRNWKSYVHIIDAAYREHHSAGPGCGCHTRRRDDCPQVAVQYFPAGVPGPEARNRDAGWLNPERSQPKILTQAA